MLGLVGLKPSAGAYCASKGAVVLLTKQIAVEYGADKIHCNALCPGCEYFYVRRVFFHRDLVFALSVFRSLFPDETVASRISMRASTETILRETHVVR